MGARTLLQAAGKLAAIADGYEAPPGQREHLVDARIHQMLRYAHDLEARSVTDPAFAALADLGVARSARRDAEWVGDNLAVFSAAVRAAPGGPTG